MRGLVLLSPLTLIAIPGLYMDASPPVTLAEAAILVAIAYALDRRSAGDGAPATSPPAPGNSGGWVRLGARPHVH